MAQTNVQAFSGDVEISSNLAVNTNDLFVDTVSSRVGIGTTSPQENFHLYGSSMIQHETRYSTASAGWYKIGTWDAASTDGARLKISLLGASTYSNNARSRGGETIIYASINNNNPTTVSNMSGSIQAYGIPIITGAKFKQVSTDRSKYEIHVYMQVYTQHSMKIECNSTTTFTREFTSSSDPGDDSSTVQSALFSHIVDNSGNVGIGITNPTSRLDVTQNFGGSGPGVPLAKIVANDGGIEFGVQIGEKTADPFTRTSLRVVDAGETVLMVDGYQKRVGVGTESPKQAFEVDSSDYGLFSGRLGVGAVLTSAQNGGGQDIWNLGTSAKLVVRSPQGANPDSSYANARTYAGIAFVPQFDASDTTNMGLWGSTSGENPVFYIQNQVNNGASGGGRIALQPVSGTVGIGTTSPKQGLHVRGNGVATLGNWGDGSRGSHILVKDTGGSPGNGGGILFGASQADHFAGIKGAIIDGGGNSAGNLTFYTRVSVNHDYLTAAMTLRNNGYIGIGNTSPISPIYVTNGQAGTFYPQWMHWLTNFNINGTAQSHSYPVSALPGNVPVGIYSQYSVGTQSYLFSQGGGLTGSDRRIKKDIVDIDDESALETLRLLKPKRYSYKDTFNRGSNPVWGFIAQEVLDVLPYSASLQNDVIPNIYETANVSYSNVITFNNFNTSNLESNANTITILDLGGARHEVEIARIIDDNTIQVVEDLSEFTMSYDGTGNVVIETVTTNITEGEYEELSEDEQSGYGQTDSGYSKTVTTYPGTELFVFGQKVDDFHYLKKDAIWTVAAAALQEVDRQQQNDQQRITTLETQLTSILTRLDALEST